MQETGERTARQLRAEIDKGAYVYAGSDKANTVCHKLIGARYNKENQRIELETVYFSGKRQWITAPYMAIEDGNGREIITMHTNINGKVDRI